MTDMSNQRDSDATVEHARSIIRKLEGTSVKDLHPGSVESGKESVIKRRDGAIGHVVVKNLRGRFSGKRGDDLS